MSWFHYCRRLGYSGAIRESSMRLHLCYNKANLESGGNTASCQKSFTIFSFSPIMLPGDIFYFLFFFGGGGVLRFIRCIWIPPSFCSVSFNVTLPGERHGVSSLREGEAGCQLNFFFFFPLLQRVGDTRGQKKKKKFNEFCASVKECRRAEWLKTRVLLRITARGPFYSFSYIYLFWFQKWASGNYSTEACKSCN